MAAVTAISPEGSERLANPATTAAQITIESAA